MREGEGQSRCEGGEEWVRERGGVGEGEAPSR